MNREIKFRGRNDKHGWLTGHYIVNRGVHFIVEDGIANPLNTWEDYAVDPDTVGQYTGLKDRNGKEIWEGDTVGYRFTDSSSVTGKVVWWGARCGFYIRTRENDYYELTEHCQVIDTFSDNPELLEGEK